MLVAAGVVAVLGSLGANCEPTPPACSQMRPDCKALGQITSCINYCRVPVADGARCVFDSCDLYSANPVSNAGVCAENSTCVLRAGETDPRAGVCVARAQNEIAS